MTFARVNPPGWGYRAILTSAQQNQLDLNVSRALDGYAGGTYNPSAPLTWNNQLIVDAGLGSGTNLIGIQGTGKGTGAGVKGIGDTNAFGLDGQGAGTGAGVRGIGGASNAAGVRGYGNGSGEGIWGFGGSSNGPGVYGEGGGAGYGVRGVAGDGTTVAGTGVKGEGGSPSTSGSGGYGVHGEGGTGKDASKGGRGVYGYGGASQSGTEGGEGVYGYGGSPNGIGVRGRGTGTGHGGYFYNTGSGYGLVAEGKDASPVKAAFMITPQSGTPSSLDDGAMWFYGNDAWAYVDGYSRPIAPCRCYAKINDSAVSPTSPESFNVQSVSYASAQQLRVTFSRAFTDADYAVVLGTESVASILVQISNRTTTYVEIQHIDTTTGAVLSWGSNNCKVHMAIFGGTLT